MHRRHCQDDVGGAPNLSGGAGCARRVPGTALSGDSCHFFLRRAERPELARAPPDLVPGERLRATRAPVPVRLLGCWRFALAREGLLRGAFLAGAFLAGVFLAGVFLAGAFVRGVFVRGVFVFDPALLAVRDAPVALRAPAVPPLLAVRGGGLLVFSPDAAPGDFAGPLPCGLLADRGRPRLRAARPSSRSFSNARRASAMSCACDVTRLRRASLSARYSSRGVSGSIRYRCSTASSRARWRTSGARKGRSRSVGAGRTIPIPQGPRQRYVGRAGTRGRHAGLDAGAVRGRRQFLRARFGIRIMQARISCVVTVI